MSQADAENRNAQFCNCTHIVDNCLIFGRVARTIRQHDAVRSHCLDFFCTGHSRQNGDFTSTGNQFIPDVPLVAKVEQCHPIFRVRVAVDTLLVACNRADGILNGVSTNLFQQSIFLCIDIFCGDCTVHDTVFPNLSGQATGINAVNADDVLFFQERIHIAFHPEIGWGIAPFPYDIATDIGAVRLAVCFVHAVVSDQRKCLDDQLTVIARVGHGFLIGSHTRRKYDFSDCRSLDTKMNAL